MALNPTRVYRRVLAMDGRNKQTPHFGIITFGSLWQFYSRCKAEIYEMGNSSSRRWKRQEGKQRENAQIDGRTIKIDDGAEVFEENLYARQDRIPMDKVEAGSTLAACEQRRSVSSLVHVPMATNFSSTLNRNKKRCFSETNVLLKGVLRKEPFLRNADSKLPIGNCDRFNTFKQPPTSSSLWESLSAVNDYESKLPLALCSAELDRLYQGLKREEQLMSEIRLLKLQKIMLKNRLDSMEHDRETLKIKCQALELQLSQKDRSASTPSLLNPRSPIIRKFNDQNANGNYQRNLASPSIDRRVNRPYSRPQVTFNLTPDTIQYSSNDDPLDSFDILCQKLKSEINVLENQLNHVNRRVESPISNRSSLWSTKRPVRR
ncbi:hypothetical protein TTRE_0000290201 [Trichuris trichiura]|uniref:Uncharacterized protein n=1 Tax=Trichuris trichiura TaxID=36087 RepID=A0A077Z2I7_TRITR|nr:hypothetical protein TTRE_0000290201 [Trichuris trichiura]